MVNYRKVIQPLRANVKHVSVICKFVILLSADSQLLNIFILWKWLYIAIKSYEEIFWTFEAVLKLKTSENCTFYDCMHDL